MELVENRSNDEIIWRMYFRTCKKTNARLEAHIKWLACAFQGKRGEMERHSIQITLMILTQKRLTALKNKN